MNIRTQSLKLLLAIISILNWLVWERASTLAQLPPAIINQSYSLKVAEGDRVIFTPPAAKESRGKPPNTVNGSNRGCGVNENLVALVPIIEPNSEEKPLWGLTTKERPTFWVYISNSPGSIISGKFSLRRWNSENHAEITVYESELTLTNTPGIISFTLPATAPPLEINQWYYFYFFINVECPQNLTPKKLSVQRLIRREEPNTDLKTQLQAATLLQQAILYGKNGFWYDMLKALAELKRTEPKNQQWREVLRSSGLEKIASEPIVDCCTPPN